MRLAALSVDLDEVDCYAAIHGLDAETAQGAIYRHALPRFERLFAEAGVPATFFAIGRDLHNDTAREAVSRLHGAGHEIANHSFDHFYDLTRRDRATMSQQVQRCSETLRQITGEAPRGFRAPGYVVNDTLLEVLVEQNMAYDSSVFPCPAYFSAKALALAAITLRGRRSHSIHDTPRMLGAPADPYRVGLPYSRRGDGLRELPIGVTSNLSGRLPYIGTSLILAGPTRSAWLTRRIVGRPLVNLELHGIDLADAGPDGLDFLRPHQPDLRVSLEDKLTVLRTAMATLRNADYEFVTLSAAAARLD